jgi:inhibitor of KinA sporulation pathway (predicted exonuclease)
MNYIVLDLEWNQGNAAKETQDPVMPFEVVEIGAVKLSEERKHLDDYSRLVKPSCYHTMHFITGKLIHIRLEDLQNEQTFPEVIGDFLHWCGQDPVFCSWGPLDLTELQRNMRWHGLPPLSDGPLPFFDVQKLFSIAREDRKIRRSLENAVDMMELEKPIPFHRAHDDAFYTAEIFAALPASVLDNCSYDYFSIPADRESEIHRQFDTYAKYISRGFPERQDALRDKEVMSTRCYLCGKELKKKIRWFTTNGKHYYSVSACPEHGSMKAKIRIRRSEDGLTYVVKTEKFITDAEVDALEKRAAKAAKKDEYLKYQAKRDRRLTLPKETAPSSDVPL